MMCRPPSATTRSCSASHCALKCAAEPLPVGPADAVERVEVVEVDELVVVDELLFALRQPLGQFVGQAPLARHELGVAAEQDVGAAAGHVRGDRHRAEAAGLRHDLGFLRVELRVQDDVLDRRVRRSMPASFSDFSIDTVPTSVGRPCSCWAVMSATMASYFSGAVR